jgi:hypothetical protein
MSKAGIEASDNSGSCSKGTEAAVHNDNRRAQRRKRRRSMYSIESSSDSDAGDIGHDGHTTRVSGWLSLPEMCAWATDLCYS